MSNEETGIDEIEHEIDEEMKRRPRSATLLNLKWIAQKFRKKSQVSSAIKDGNYTVDSDSIARAMVNKEEAS